MKLISMPLDENKLAEPVGQAVPDGEMSFDWIPAFAGMTQTLSAIKRESTGKAGLNTGN